MRPRHRVSRAAIDLIKGFEGYRRKAAQLPDGRWTLGHGHVLTAREGAEVSEEDAEALLLYDLIAVTHVVNEAVFAPLTQGQFDALCSFAFNIGLDNFRHSQALKRLNEGAAIEAAFAMELWRAAEFDGERIVVDALVRRRAVERAMFLTPPDQVWTPAPSPIVRPLADARALEQAPSGPARSVTTSMAGPVELSRDGAPASEAPPPVEPPAGQAVQAAAEAVAARLQTIFPEPREPETGAVSAPDEPRSQADSNSQAAPAPTVSSYPEAPAAEPIEHPVEADRAPQQDLAREAMGDPALVRAFIPARKAPARRPRGAGVVADIVAGLLGLTFFGFGVFWGLNARSDPGSGPFSPLTVAWTAGLAGVAFFVVAVFRLLERLSRAADRN